MTSATATPTPLDPAPRHETGRVTFSSLVRAEWIALSSLRGTVISWIIGTVLVILPAAAFAAVYGAQYTDSGHDPAMLEWLPSVGDISMNGFFFAIAMAVVIGSAAFAKEHTTGSLRAVLSAAPKRFGVISAKALVVAITTFVATLVAFALAFAAAWIVGGAFGLPTGIDDVVFGAILPIVGAGIFAAATAVFTLGVAAMLRSETWAVTSALVFVFILPMILATLPWTWGAEVSDVLLGTTGQNLVVAHPAITGELVVDLVLTIAWGAVAFFGGAAVMKRRDA